LESIERGLITCSSASTQTLLGNNNPPEPKKKKKNLEIDEYKRMMSDEFKNITLKVKKCQAACFLRFVSYMLVCW
jgi:hypothetical protein